MKNHCIASFKLFMNLKRDFPFLTTVSNNSYFSWIIFVSFSFVSLFFYARPMPVFSTLSTPSSSSASWSLPSRCRDVEIAVNHIFRYLHFSCCSSTICIWYACHFFQLCFICFGFICLQSYFSFGYAIIRFFAPLPYLLCY